MLSMKRAFDTLFATVLTLNIYPAKWSSVAKMNGKYLIRVDACDQIFSSNIRVGMHL